MRSKLFNAIVLVGASLGAGCRSDLLALTDGGTDASSDAASAEAADLSAAVSMAADLATPVDASTAPDLATDGPCTCPVLCPSPTKPHCMGLCSDGCTCYPCFS